HVAGTIGAAGVDPNAIGMAPGVRIESYDWNNDTAQMLSRAATGPGQPNNIYVSNHSYGYVVGWVYYATTAMTRHIGWHYTGEWKGRDSYDNLFGQYNTTARQWDDVAYMNSCYLAFAAAGNDRNDGPQPGDTVYYYRSGWHEIVYSPSTCPPVDGGSTGGYDTISGPAVAKNIVTVGAVNNAVSAGTRSCVKTAMTKFSCWGPTDDGRIKPDIVAAGVDVYSCDHDGDHDYTVYGGTSMASPAAAGSAILLVEHYAKLFPGQAMRSATLKALILHTADDLGRVGPDYQYGWGLMNTRAAAELIQEDRDCQVGDLIVEDSLDKQNSADSYYLHSDGASPIRITLCWIDPPAAAINSSLDDSSPRLINDLDLRLIGPGGSPVYRPYVLDPAVPAAPARTGDNKLDNVEQVYVAAPGQAGTYEIRVAIKTLTGSVQRYSLISSQPLVNQRAPAAEDVRKTIARNTPVTITLQAADEGLPTPPGKLTYTIASLPQHGTLTYPDGTPIVKPMALAQNASQVVYKPAGGFLGEDSFTFSADDGGPAPFGGVSNTAAATISVQDITTLRYQVGSGEDDATALTGWQVTSGTSLRLGQYISGMRFQGVQTPKGARIVSATLRLYTRSVAKCKGAVYAEATGDAKDFTLMNARIYDRAKTQASVSWNWSGAENPWQWYGSPDIAGVVQEIVDRSDWSAGNDLVIHYVGKELMGDMPDFHSWESDPAYAPKLEIEFTAGSVGGGSAGSQTNPAGPGHSAPVAANLSLYANTNTPASIALAATDDGLPAPLDFVIDSLPAHGSLEYPDGTAIAKTGTLAAHIGGVVYRPSENFAGNDTFRFHASDGGSAPSGGNSNVAAVTVGVRNMVTREYQVILPEDDAYGADGPAVVLSDLLSVGRNDSAMRFQNVDVLPGSEIVGARLKVGIGTSTIKARMSGALRAQDVANAADFSSPSVRIPNMAKTQASVPWTWQTGDCGPAGAFHASPDIGAVVQEIVDRPDWLIDNALAILYSGDRTTSQDVQLLACDSPYSARAARLEITCGLLEAEILPPTVNQAVPVATDAVMETPFDTALTVTLPATDDDLPNPPGRLTYIIAALPDHGTLEDSQGKPITGSAVLPDCSNQVVYKPASGYMGPDTFTFYVDDGAVPESSGESNIAAIRVMVRPPLTKKLNCSRYVKSSEDDAYATRQDTSNKYTQPTLLVGLNSAGMRFTDIAIPQGSKILSAHLTVRAANSRAIAGILQAEATGNAASFSQNDRVVGELPLTNAFVTWGGADTVLPTPSKDISQVVQEVIDRPDWASGNAIAIVLWSQSIPSTDLQILAYDNSPTTAALTAPALSISYAPNDPSQDLQFLAYGVMAPYRTLYDPSLRPPAALEITHAP
ncbi:MAG: S8 family serine peptidase, partial [Phycisphaerales bacterium]